MNAGEDSVLVAPRPLRGPATRSRSPARNPRRWISAVRPAYVRRMASSVAVPISQPQLLRLPRQPEGVAWPTDVWPRAELDGRVDRIALERLLDRAFAEPEPDDLERT